MKEWVPATQDMSQRHGKHCEMYRDTPAIPPARGRIAGSRAYAFLWRDSSNHFWHGQIIKQHSSRQHLTDEQRTITCPKKAAVRLAIELLI